MNKIQIWLKSKLISLILIAIIIAQLLLSTGCSRLETGAVWVRELLVVEVGAESISADQFVSNVPDDVTPLFVGSLDHIDLNTPGDYELQIALGDKVYDSVLRVVAADDPRLLDPKLNSQDASYAKYQGTTESGEATQPSQTDESQELSLEESEFSTFSQGDVTITGTGTDLGGGNDTNTAETKDGEKSVTANMAAVKTAAAKTGSKDTSREVNNGSVPPVPTPTITPYSPLGSAGSATLNALCDGILASLINNEMSTYQIARKAYDFARSFTYTAGQSSNYYVGAEYGLKYRRGNCFTQAFAAEALMRRAGISATHMTEYENRHCWAMVGSKVVDPNGRRFWVELSTLKDVTGRGGFYLYRTYKSDPPKVTSKVAYRNIRTISHGFVYMLNPDQSSKYPDQKIETPGIDGVMYDQWNEFYREGVRTPEKDYPVSIDVVKAPIDEVILIGQLYSVVEKRIKAIAGTETVPTDDKSLDGTRVPNTGKDGLQTTTRRVTELDPATGKALSFHESVVTTAKAIPFKVYVYEPPSSEPGETKPDDTNPEDTLPDDTNPEETLPDDTETGSDTDPGTTEAPINPT